MYKLLLCWRYLRTRYIALASIISVMLGVATMIVVNSVMAGFTHEMRDRIHGILSDVVLEAHGTDGFPDADWHMQRIRADRRRFDRRHDADCPRAGDACLRIQRAVASASRSCSSASTSGPTPRSANSPSICSTRLIASIFRSTSATAATTSKIIKWAPRRRRAPNETGRLALAQVPSRSTAALGGDDSYARRDCFRRCRTVGHCQSIR